MSALVGQHGVSIFNVPVRRAEGKVNADEVRGNDNTLRAAYVSHDADASIHIQSGTLSARPATAVDGATYFCTDTQDTYTWVSGAWVQSAWAHWYGDFYDTTDQVIGTINTEQLVTMNSIGTVRGTSLVSGSQMTVAYAGHYNIMFSAQMKNTDSTEHDVFFWWKKNGTNVSDSGGKVTVPKKHGSDDGHTLAVWNINITLAANDYVQLYWQGPSTALSIETIPAAGSVPRTPSVIATINRI